MPKSRRSGTAVEGIRAFARDLSEQVPAFGEAAQIEEEADAFCRSVRAALAGQRGQQQLGQTELAEAMDLSQSAVSRIESGTGDIGLKTIYRYARALGIRPHVSFAPSLAMRLPEAALQNVKFAAVAAELDEAQQEFIESINRTFADYNVQLGETLTLHANEDEEERLAMSSGG